jgi:putative oxidoreductase
MKTAADGQNSNSSCLICVFRRGYRLLIQGASLLQSPLLLAIRLYWGLQFFETGKGKLMNHEKVTGFFQTLHIPFPSFNVYLVGSTECFGGLLLLVGLGSRLVCLPLITTLIVAYLTAETEIVKNIFNDPDKFTGAAEFLFLFACMMVLAFGPGRFSIDWFLAKTKLGKDDAAAP